MAKSLSLYFDVLSPYSWFAFEYLTRVRQVWNFQLILKPVSIAHIMKESNNKPPGMNPNKGQYMFKDLARISDYLAMPMKVPTDVANVLFVKGSKSAMRFVTAVNLQSPQHTEELSRQFWKRVWSSDQDICEEASLLATAKVANVPANVIDDCMKKLNSEEVVGALIKNTNDAVNLKAFGLPVIEFELNGKTEMVFGSDRFHIIAHMLGKEYPGPLNNLAAKI